MQAKDRELARTQEQLRQVRQQVSVVAIRCCELHVHVLCVL